MHFAELSSGKTNQTVLIALLIIQGKTFVEGIENVYKHIAMEMMVCIPESVFHLFKIPET